MDCTSSRRPQHSSFRLSIRTGAPVIYEAGGPWAVKDAVDETHPLICTALGGQSQPVAPFDGAVGCRAVPRGLCRGLTVSGYTRPLERGYPGG